MQDGKECDAFFNDSLWRPPFPARIYRFYSEDEVARLAMDCGFGDVEVTHRHIRGREIVWLGASVAASR